MTNRSKKQEAKSKKNKGFTLIELLVTISIAIVLLSTGLSAFKKFGRQAVLDNTASQIRDAILTTRNLALAPEANKPSNIGYYGISFDIANNSYEIFESITNSCSAARTISKETLTNPPQIISAPTAICFAILPTAPVTIVGEGQIKLIHFDTNRTKTIKIDALSGQSIITD